MNDSCFIWKFFITSEIGNLKICIHLLFLLPSLHAHAHFSTEVLVPFIDFFVIFFFLNMLR